MICVLEAREDAVAEGGAVGADRNRDARRLADEHLDTRPLGSGAKARSKPGGLRVERWSQTAECLDVGTGANGNRSCALGFEEVLHVIAGTLQSTLSEKGGRENVTFELLEDAERVGVEIRACDRPRFTWYVLALLRPTRGAKNHRRLEDSAKRVFAEVGKLGVTFRESIVGGARGTVAIQLGHRAGQHKPEAPLRCEQMLNGPLDEERLEVPVAAEALIERREVPTKPVVERLRRAPRIGDPWGIAEDRPEAAFHSAPPRPEASAPSAKTSGNSISQWNGRIGFGPSRSSAIMPRSTASCAPV